MTDNTLNHVPGSSQEQGENKVESRNKETEIFEMFTQNDYFPRNFNGSGNIKTGEVSMFIGDNLNVSKIDITPDSGYGVITGLSAYSPYNVDLEKELSKSRQNNNGTIIAYTIDEGTGKFVPLKARTMTDEEVNQEKKEKEHLELRRGSSTKEAIKTIEMIENGSAGDQGEVRDKLQDLIYYIKKYGEAQENGITYENLNILSDKNDANFHAAAKEGVVKDSSKDKYTIELSSGELITIGKLCSLRSDEKVSVICNDKDVLLRKQGDEEPIYKLEYMH